MKSILQLSVYSLILLLLNSSCAAPLALIGLYGTSMGSIRKQDEIARLDERWGKPEAIEAQGFIDISLQSDEQDGDGQGIIYVGEYNNIQLTISPNIDPSAIRWETTMGKIGKTDDPNVYTIWVERAGLAVEITAVDTVSGLSAVLSAVSKNLPSPIACLNMTETGDMDAATFKKQGQLMLKTDHLPIAALCTCNGFRLTRIASDGKRETLKNERDAFSVASKALVAKAQKGDVYIFDEIAAQCPGDAAPRTIRSLVYVLK